MIDLRSDTVTLPTAQMYDSMACCSLGDDGLDGDPTARELEALAASMLCKEAGLYVPSATLGNLLAVLLQTARQEQVIAESRAHIYETERGAAALTGTFYQPIAGHDGAMDLQLLGAALEPGHSKMRTALVCMETSHNSAGGTVLPLEHMQSVFEMSRAAGASIHLDGARLFNAAVALGVPAADMAAFADTVTLCLSKGLSAPMGAVLCGSHKNMARARELRKMLGGSQRQVGIAAAAGIVALTTMVDRLSEDHATASQLARGLGEVPGLAVSTPSTNIVFVNVSASRMDARAWEMLLKKAGVLVRAWDYENLRCVTHRHVSDSDVHSAIDAFASIAG